MKYVEAVRYQEGDSVIVKRTGEIVVIEKILHHKDQRGIEFVCSDGGIYWHTTVRKI